MLEARLSSGLTFFATCVRSSGRLKSSRLCSYRLLCGHAAASSALGSLARQLKHCGSSAILELHSERHALCVQSNRRHYFSLSPRPMHLRTRTNVVLVGTFCGLLVSADGIPSTCFQLRFRNYFHQWKANCSITFVRWNCLLSTACSGLHLKCYPALVITSHCRCAPTTPVRSWSLPRGLHLSKFWARFCVHFSTSSAGTVFVHQWSIFLVTGMIWRMSSVALRVHRRPCHPQNVCIHLCIFCCAHVGAYVVLLRPNGLGCGRECETSCARSCYEGTCSGLSPSGRSELLFGAAPPCISLFEFVSDGIDCIPFRFARFRCLGVFITSNFVSFAGVGHVCAPFGKTTCPSAACIRI